MIYGTELPTIAYGPTGVIGEVAASVAGNVVLRVGRINVDSHGWHQTEHIVLTIDEARTLIRELTELTEHAILEPWEAPMMSTYGDDEVAAMREP